MLSRGNGAEPDSLDPQLARMDSALTILRDCYEGLASLARDAKVAPGAASSWTVSDDALTYTLKIRQGVKFHDGSPMTVERMCPTCIGLATFGEE